MNPLLQFWRSRHWAARLARMLLVGYALVNALAWFAMDSLMFPRWAISEPYEPVPATCHAIADDGARVVMEWRPLTNANAKTILFCHGNGEHMGQVRGLCADLRARGFQVLAWEYRGYGAAEGRPNERGLCRDIETAYRWLREEQDVAARDIVVYGRSVGGGPAVWLAANHEVGGLVLESAFRSAGRVTLGFRFLLFDRFDSQARIGRIDCPLLLIHGTADRVIGPGHSETLFRLAAEPKRLLLVEGAGHNDLHNVLGENYGEGLRWMQSQ